MIGALAAAPEEIPQETPLVTTATTTPTMVSDPVIYTEEATTEAPETVETIEVVEAGIYHLLTEREISLLEVTVQHEVGNFSTEYKTLVAELIYNRILSDKFPDTVEGVLYQENQFCGIERWYYEGFPVDDETRQVVKDVFSKDTTSHPALFYYNPKLSEYSSVMWFEYSGDITFLFEHTEALWDVDYTTRFFV